MTDDADPLRAVIQSAYTAVEWPEPELAVVRFYGEIDLGSAPALEESILRQTAAASAVVLDLTGVTFLDSAGVRLFDSLVGVYDRCGLQHRLVAPAQSVARFTLRLCAFRADLIEPNVPAARAAVG
jgi:anti-sigma B factor antagonist